MNQCHHHHHHQEVTGPGRLPSWSTWRSWKSWRPPSASPSWCDGGHTFEVIATGGSYHQTIQHLEGVSKTYPCPWTSQHPIRSAEEEGGISQPAPCRRLSNFMRFNRPPKGDPFNEKALLLDLNSGGWWNPIDNYDIWWLVTNYGPSYF